MKIPWVWQLQNLSLSSYLRANLSLSSYSSKSSQSSQPLSLKNEKLSKNKKCYLMVFLPEAFHYLMIFLRPLGILQCWLLLLEIKSFYLLIERKTAGYKIEIFKLHLLSQFLKSVTIKVHQRAKQCFDKNILKSVSGYV